MTAARAVLRLPRSLRTVRQRRAAAAMARLIARWLVAGLVFGILALMVVVCLPKQSTGETDTPTAGGL